MTKTRITKATLEKAVIDLNTIMNKRDLEISTLSAAIKRKNSIISNLARDLNIYREQFVTMAEANKMLAKCMDNNIRNPVSINNTGPGVINIEEAEK